MGAYRDFIPEGEDTGALGNGFQDFVPPKKNKPESTKETPEDKNSEQPAKPPVNRNPFAKR